MDSIHQCYHWQLHKKLVREIYLGKESSLCVDPEFGDPSRGKAPWRSIWCTQGFPACHLIGEDEISWKQPQTHSQCTRTMPLFHLRAKNYTSKSMVSANKRNVLPRSCIKPCIPHISYYTMLSAASRKKPSKVVIIKGNQNCTCSITKRVWSKL